MSTVEYSYTFEGLATFEVHNITTAYRVRIAWDDGHESWIGDWPTKRIAAREAENYILTDIGVTPEDIAALGDLSDTRGADLAIQFKARRARANQPAADLLPYAGKPDSCQGCGRVEPMGVHFSDCTLLEEGDGVVERAAEDARPTCSNLACPLASTLLDPDGALCGYCQDRLPGVEVVS